MQEITNMHLKRGLIIFTSLAMFAAGTAFADMHHQGHGYHEAGPFELFSPKVVEQLHLNSAQTQALDKIQAERKAMFTEMRSHHQMMKESMQKALKSDTPDLRTLARQTDAAMDQMRDNMRKIQNQELDLYDTLNAQQKKTVRDELLKRMSYMEHHRDWKPGQPKPQKPAANTSPGI
jgi:Spy/CpxP family protein refolding chaperone